MGLYFVFTPFPGHGSVATIVSSQVHEKLNLPLVPVTSEFECVCIYVCTQMFMKEPGM